MMTATPMIRRMRTHTGDPYPHPRQHLQPGTCWFHHPQLHASSQVLRKHPHTHSPACMPGVMSEDDGRDWCYETADSSQHLHPALILQTCFSSDQSRPMRGGGKVDAFTLRPAPPLCKACHTTNDWGSPDAGSMCTLIVVSAYIGQLNCDTVECMVFTAAWGFVD
jgi:hypothetical protein